VTGGKKINTQILKEGEFIALFFIINLIFK